MALIQRQRRRGLHRVHQVSLQQFRKSVLRQSTVTDNIGQYGLDDFNLDKRSMHSLDFTVNWLFMSCLKHLMWSL